jgi:hypothetical protein
MATLVGDGASAWASGAMQRPTRSLPPTAMNSGRGVFDTLNVAYSGTSTWAQESAKFSLRQLPGPEPAGWRYTPTAPPSFNDASAAICDGASEDLIISMLRYHPVLASQKNKFGVTLLHWAAYYCASDAVVRALVAANADAARQVSASDGCLPLHVGAAWNLSPFGLATIFAAFPEALEVLDANGLTPPEKAERAGHPEVGALLRDREQLLHALTCNDTRGKIITAIMDKARGPKTAKGPPQLTHKHADRLAALRIELESLDLTKLRHRAIAAGIDPRALGSRPPPAAKTAAQLAAEADAKLSAASGAVGGGGGGGKARRPVCEECGFAAATHCHRDDPEDRPRWCTGCATEGPAGIPSAVPLPTPHVPSGGETLAVPGVGSDGKELRLRDHESYQARIRSELGGRLRAEARVEELEGDVVELQRQLKAAGEREDGLMRMLDVLAARDAEGVRSDNEWWGERDARNVGEQIAHVLRDNRSSRGKEKQQQQRRQQRERQQGQQRKSAGLAPAATATAAAAAAPV